MKSRELEGKTYIELVKLEKKGEIALTRFGNTVYFKVRQLTKDFISLESGDGVEVISK